MTPKDMANLKKEFKGTEQWILHAKTGYHYLILHFGCVQLDGIWYNCCIYQDTKMNNYYVRKLNDFAQFTRV